MPDINTYDFNDISFIVDGVIATGLSDGDDAVSCGQNEDNFKESVGAQGDVILNEINNKTGFFKVKVQSTSPACAQYEKLANTGVLVPVQVIDSTTGGINASCTKGRVKKTPDKKWGATSSEREYEFFAIDYKTKE
ncbi:DUF3277 family protein [Acetobacterium paludosum]|uniref:DUF3277 family protein n=1 Tax=Acetobacterium paludosum TaxID=52693 RepID=A0A923I5S7_9FIRM|nr:phage protein [Acetobacterium paludosum]MBC3889515.1 DUF3277 family protein [Acetobacterium paludosum]